MRLGEMAHRIESEIASIGSESVASQEFEFLLTRFDGMQNAFEGLRHLDAIAAQGLPALVEDVPVITIEPDLQDIHVFRPENDAEIPSVVDSTRVITSANAYARKIEIPGPQAMVMQPLRQAANASIRVRTQLLDRMVNQAGEVMITPLPPGS